MDAFASPSPDMGAALHVLLGASGIVDDPAELAIAGSYRLPDAEACVPELLIRPGNTEATAARLAVLARHQMTVTPLLNGLTTLLNE
jgi:hypothetical protein